jgi:hypothetical protein
MSDGGSDKNPTQFQYPYFQSAGGVTPQQTSLADYDYGQNLLTGQAEFEGGGEGGGTGMSTMATQVAGGANIGKALQLGQESDTDQGAEYQAYQNAINLDQQNNAAGLAENQQSSTDLGTSLGTLAGIGSVGKTASAT